MQCLFATIGDRLISHAPDITRLLARMVRRGLVTRGRDALDKRLVQSRITAPGLDLLEQSTACVAKVPAAIFHGSTDDEVPASIEMLEKVRCAAGGMQDGYKVGARQVKSRV